MVVARWLREQGLDAQSIQTYYEAEDDAEPTEDDASA